MLSSRTDNDGVTGKLPFDIVQYTILSACTATAWAFSIELLLIIHLSNKGRYGRYFWSLLAACLGCIVHALGFVLKFLVGTTWLCDLAFIGIGR